MFKKDVFEHVRFNEKRIHEDEFIAHHIIGEAESISVITDILYHYRIREGSITSSEQSQSLRKFDYMDALEDRLLYCRGMMFGDVYIYMLYTYFEGLKQLMVKYNDETIKKIKLFNTFRKRAQHIYRLYFFDFDSYQKKDYLKMILFTKRYREKMFDENHKE